MVKFLLFLSGLLLGVLLVSTPDLVSLYADHVIGTYQKRFCNQQGIGPDKCSFDMYYYAYQGDHKKLSDLDNYFLLGHGPMYWVLSGRCTEEPMYNISALGENNGKITKREYFLTQCSQFNNDVSDFLFGKPK